MPHSILVGFLSPTEFSARMIEAITEKKVITEKNMHIVDPHRTYESLYEGHAYNLYAECTDALIQSEIAVIATTKGTLSTILAKVSGVTRGKTILTMCEDVDCAYVQSLVAKGTLIVSAPPTKNKDGVWETKIEYSSGFPQYMKAACEDIIGSICKIKL